MASKPAPAELMAYAYDAAGEKHPPDVVLFPTKSEQVAACVWTSLGWLLTVVTLAELLEAAYCPPVSAT